MIEAVTAPRRPGLLTDLGAAALALVLVGIAGWLGLWQYDAWQAHRTAEARDLSAMSPVPLTDVMGSDDPFPAPDLGRPVEVAGEWLDGGFWVADRSLDGEPGYWAVTPLQTGDAAVLVVRGWAPEPDADLLAASGEAEVTGWLQPPEGTLVVDDDPAHALAHVARGASLLVVGSRGMGAFRGMLLGAVSNEAVRSAPGTVMVVHDLAE